MSFLDTNAGLREFDKPFAPRANEKNPRSPFCNLHLQRICGTCAHFAGHLRQAEDGTCTQYAAPVAPDRSAWGCTKWDRKLAGPGK